MHLVCHSPVPGKSRLWHQQDPRALYHLNTWHNTLKGILALDLFICGHAPPSAHLNCAETTAWSALHNATVSPCTQDRHAKPPGHDAHLTASVNKRS